MLIDAGLGLVIVFGGVMLALRSPVLDWRGVGLFALLYAVCLLLAAEQPSTLWVDFALIPVFAAALALDLAGELSAIIGGAVLTLLLAWLWRRVWSRADAAPRLPVWPVGVYGAGAIVASAVYHLAGGTLNAPDPLHPMALVATVLAGAALALVVGSLILLRLVAARQIEWITPVALRRLLVTQGFSLVLGALLGWSYLAHEDRPWISVLVVGAIGTGLGLLHLVGQARSALERRVMELAALNRIGQVLTADLATTPLFDVIHQQVRLFCDVPTFYIALYDAARGRVTFPYVWDNGRPVQWASRAFTNGVTEHIIQTRRSLLLSDGLAAQVRALGLSVYGRVPACYLGVPLIVGDEVIGVMALQHDSNPRAYGEYERALLETIGLQAAVALRNTWLYEEAQMVSTELQELVASSREFSATLDLSALANSIVRRLQHAIPASGVSLLEWLADGDGLRLLAHVPADSTERAQHLLNVHHADLRALNGAAYWQTLELDEDGRVLRVWALPLVARERPVGLALVWDPSDEAWPESAERLVEGIIHQAAVALQNAQTYYRADTSLRERVIELSALEVISRHMAATLDLDTILNDVLAAAMSAIDATLGCCGLVMDDERFMVVAMLEQSGAQIDLPMVRRVGEGVTGRVLRTRRPVMVDDVQARPGITPLFAGMRSELCVPIVREGHPIGVLDFEDPRANAFSEAHMRFVSMLAEHAAIAIENARLFTDRRRQIETLVNLRRLSTHLLAAAWQEPVAEAIIRYARDIIHAKHVFLYWTGEDGLPQATAPDQDCPPPDAIVRRVAQTGQPYYSLDVSTLPVYQVFMPLDDFEARACVPIRHGDRVLGVLDVLITDSVYYTQNEIQALEVLADQAAVAIESIHLNDAVRAGRDQLQAILDSTREGILLFDLDGRLLRVNPAAEEMLGQSLAPVIGRSFVEWLRTQGAARLKALTGYTLADLRRDLRAVSADPRRITHRQFEQQRDDGTRYIDEIASPVLDERGETVIGRMLVWHDVSEERKLDDLRQELSSMIVHDLRSPLTSIINSLAMVDELLAQEQLDGDILREVIGIAAQSSQNMLRLVESLLDIARLEQRRVALNLSACPLQDVIDDACASVLSLAVDADIALDTDVAGDVPPVWIDQEQIQRVLVNLLDNALRHTPAGGRVRVEAAPLAGGEGVRVAVCDSGPGIPPEERGMVFEKFVQLDRPVLRGHKGSGLGLTFCKLAVEAHGGRIWVEDTALGGAAFCFTLPVADGGRAARNPTLQTDRTLTSN